MQPPVPSTQQRALTKGHYVELPLPGLCARVDAAANGADDNIVVIRELGEVARVEHVPVELVVVHHWKHHRVHLKSFRVSPDPISWWEDFTCEAVKP